MLPRSSVISLNDHGKYFLSIGLEFHDKPLGACDTSEGFLDQAANKGISHLTNPLFDIGLVQLDVSDVPNSIQVQQSRRLYDNLSIKLPDLIDDILLLIRG